MACRWYVPTIVGKNDSNTFGYRGIFPCVVPVTVQLPTIPWWISRCDTRMKIALVCIPSTCVNVDIS